MTASRERMLQRLAVGATLAAAVAVRLWYVLHEAMPVVDSDAFAYDSAAVRLLTKGYFAYASGGLLGLKPNAFTVPGFMVFLAGIYRAFGMGEGRYIAVYVAQALLSAATVGLVYLIGRRVTDRPWAGVAAAIVAAVYPPFVLGAGIIMTETVYAFALTALVWLVLWATDRGVWWAFLLAGLWFGVATLIRPTAAPWMLAVAAYLFAKAYGWRRVAVSMAALALGWVLVMSPWWVRNYTVLHRVVVFNSITSNPLMRSTYLYLGAPPRFRLEWPARYGQDEFAFNDYQGRVAAERVGWSLRHDPWGFVRTRLGRTKDSLQRGWAIPKEGLVAGLTALLQVPLLVLGFLSPVFWPRRAEVWLVWLVPVLFVAVHTALLIFPRYVFPTMPLVIVLAVAAVWGMAGLAGRLLGRREGDRT